MRNQMIRSLIVLLFAVLVFTTHFGVVSSKVVETFTSLGFNRKTSPFVQIWMYTPMAGWATWIRLSASYTPVGHAFETRMDGTTVQHRRGREWKIDAGPLTVHYYGR